MAALCADWRRAVGAQRAAVSLAARGSGGRHACERKCPDGWKSWVHYYVHTRTGKTMQGTGKTKQAGRQEKDKLRLLMHLITKWPQRYQRLQRLAKPRAAVRPAGSASLQIPHANLAGGAQHGAAAWHGSDTIQVSTQLGVVCVQVAAGVLAGRETGREIELQGDPRFSATNQPMAGDLEAARKLAAVAGAPRRPRQPRCWPGRAQRPPTSWTRQAARCLQGGGSRGMSGHPPTCTQRNE